MSGDYQLDDFNDIADDSGTVKSDPMFNNQNQELFTKSPSINPNDKAKALEENSPPRDLFDDKDSTLMLIV